jgi:hypothetical protein
VRLEGGDLKAAFQDKKPKNILGVKQESGLVGAENGTVKRPKFDILFGENIFFLQNLFR